MSGWRSSLCRTAAILVVIGHAILLTGRYMSLFNTQQTTRRRLSKTEVRTCSLSKETMYFQFQEWTNSYQLIANVADERWKWTVDNSFNQSVANKGTNIPNKNNETRRELLENNTTSSQHNTTVTLRTFSQTNGAILEARACWCAEAYFNRPVEFCPASFDTCLIRGHEGLVSCYTSTGSNGFVSSFWPLACVWMLALGYGIGCTDGGTWARQYVRRIGAHPAEGQIMLQEQLDRLLDERPEHAVFLYRQAVLRIRQAYFQPRRRRGWFSAADDDSNEEEGVFLEDTRDALLLKVTTYGDAEQPEQRTASLSLTRGNVSSWRNDQITFQQMDSQMEQGLRCAICLVRLENGDIVGDIPCGHVFHKACLKTWLQQANRCPLCRQTDIASLRTCRPGRLAPESTNSLAVAQIY